MRRTNRGKIIDIDSIIAQQADVPAVGNMRVNARGDVLGGSGDVVKNAHDRVREYYEQNPKSVTKSVSIKQGSLDKTLDLEQSVSEENTKYREVEMPNGDIKMVPVDEEFDDE